MTPIQTWNNIINRLEGNKIELPTVPKTKKTPVWFSATTDGKTIFINQAIDHSPSSKLSAQRMLNYKTFQKVYPLYLRRENGEAVSSEVSAITVDQVYFFSLLKHFG
jgi:hypothetical protein